MKKIIIVYLLCCIQLAIAQVLTPEELLLNQYAVNHPELTEPIKIELYNTPLDEYVRTIGIEHEINVYAAPDLRDKMVTTNFYDIPVRQVFVFLIKEFDLQMTIESDVIIFKKKPVKIIEPEPVPEKEIDITYSKAKDLLSINLKNDSLPKVAEKITKTTGKNIVLAPNVKDMSVSAYMLNSPFDQVLDMMARSNDLVVTKDENGFYYLQKDERPKEQKGTASTQQNGNNVKKKKSGAKVELLSNGFLKIDANEADAESLITEIAELVNANYVFYDKPKGVKVSIFSNQISFDEVLDHMLKGTDFTAIRDESFYLIGKREKEGLRVQELIQFENRSMSDIIGKVPKDVKDKVDIHELPDLNGVMVSGSKPNIEELKQYINKLDQLVPLVLIDVMIVQYQKSHEVQTGLQAILDKQNQQQTGGILFPDPNVTLNASSINNLIDAFNGFGLFKIGKVTKDFYLTLSALENNSIINTKSTPSIATLSGNPATFSVGEETYYFEQNNQILNTGINNTITQSGTWRKVNADLKLEIEPWVTKDDLVTLKIKVQNDRFLARVGEGAPPGKATQNFDSEIRIRNGEMVLLGGLDELNRENSGTGTPFLSRIPIIKWFFSGRTKRKSKSKLHVFIKPTVIY